jgi:hypothetical protein
VRVTRTAERGGNWVITRNRPRRAAELLDGGSIYWVIRGQIRVRQALLGFGSGRDADGRRYCRIEVGAELVPTLPRACRPFQGLALSDCGCGPGRPLRGGGAARPDARRIARIGPDRVNELTEG